MVEWVKNQLFEVLDMKFVDPFFFVLEAWLHDPAWQGLCLCTKPSCADLALL
jgi:hypothetical protein